MSKTTTLQTRGISVQIKDKAEEQAQKDGFRNLNDAMRVFITQYAAGQIEFFGFKQERLSDQMIADYEEEIGAIFSQNTPSHDNVEDVVNDLMDENKDQY